MRPYLLNRRLHYWVGAAIAVPLLIVTGTGLLLQTKKQLPWVQAAEARATGGPPAAAWDALLGAARSAPGAAGAGWNALARIDVRPGKGLAKVQLKSGWEVQVDLATGQVLRRAFRRSDVIEALHDGFFFAGDWTKLGLFLPSALGLLALLVSGVWMVAHPVLARRRRSSARAAMRTPGIAPDRSRS